jgi:elongation factor G
MNRYNVPRIIFINKLDRLGADPERAVEMIRNELGLKCAPIQIAIGTESAHEGVVDVLHRKAYNFLGPKGDDVTEVEIPYYLEPQMEQARRELIEQLADVDEEIEELFLMEEEPTVEQLQGAIRRQTIARTFSPVFMGSAYKNKGVQLLLDGVVDYLPNPTEVTNTAYDLDNDEAEVALSHDSNADLVALAFKLEEGRFGQITYMRIYQGILAKGDYIRDPVGGSRIKVPRMVKMHSNEMIDVQGAAAGEIIAMFGVDCHSGTTFTAGQNLSMSSIYVPEPVISLAISPKSHTGAQQFRKGLNRFVKEDPTFRVSQDEESQETIISGMGELHLEIYAERLAREYGTECIVGNPKVNFRETPTKRVEFNYLHKKQSGGQGQYGRVIGYLEPLDEDEEEEKFIFENKLVGLNIPPEYHSAIRKGFEEATLGKHGITGHPIVGCRVVLLDGQSHAVDSSEMAFKTAAMYAFSQAFTESAPQVLEPVMKVEVYCPHEFQPGVLGGLTKRRGMIHNVTSNDGVTSTIVAQVPLSQMFSYSSELRSQTEGKGEYSMEFEEMMPCLRDMQDELERNWAKTRYAKAD